MPLPPDDIAPIPVCVLDEHVGRSEAGPRRDEEAFARAAALFRVVADATRLKLLDRLSEGEWCVTELAAATGNGLSTVSQQLRLLRAERIVTRRRAGKHIYYSLTDDHVRQLIEGALNHASEPRALVSDDDDVKGSPEPMVPIDPATS
jgi:ArsR family transcriptional regulator